MQNYSYSLYLGIMLVNCTMKIDKDKPSLDHLFESKKFDLPSEDFWDDFQNQVKDRALSYVPRSSHSHRIIKTSVFAAPILLILLYISFPLSSLKKEKSSVARSFVNSSSQIIDSVRTTKHIEVLESLENSEYIIVNNDGLNKKVSDSETSFFVEEKLQFNEQNSYEIQYLGNFELNQENLLARYTF